MTGGRVQGAAGPSSSRAEVLGYAVPMYVHPALAPTAWQRAGHADLGAGFLVINTADGPGPGVEPAYSAAVGALREAGTPLVGYVDTDYGNRPVESLVADLESWRAWYGIAGVFVDRVSARPGDVRQVLGVLDRLRAAGADRLVLNPGVVPPEELCRAADVTVVFEGPWTAYRRHDPPAWLRDHPPERLCHLVHSVPAEQPWHRPAERAASAGVGIVGVSHDLMPNPWTGPPVGLLPTCRKGSADHQGFLPLA